ncbi:MAG TPA: TIR domain-containing protein [Caulobacteraceae bacterium]|nr:TIR domain-containing protein [Caulobacteraceae bacterium]
MDPEQTRIMTSAHGVGTSGATHLLELVQGLDVGRRYLIGAAGVTIGRTPPAEIVLGDSEVSRAHCRVTVEGDDLMVADLGSTNGTFIDDVRLHEPTALPVGSVLTVGRQHLLRLEKDAPRGFDRLASLHGRAAVNALAAGPPPDIFLSYNRDDQATARLFAEGFQAAGLTVWWDVTLRTGEAYDEVTEAALRSAKAVVVLWSKRSVASRWVRSEATLGDRNGRLVPAMIEACERPVMFELTQTAELTHWKGDAEDAAWLAFVADVRGRVGAAAPTATGQGPA